MIFIDFPLIFIDFTWFSGEVKEQKPLDEVLLDGFSQVRCALEDILQPLILKEMSSAHSSPGIRRWLELMKTYGDVGLKGL